MTSPFQAVSLTYKKAPIAIREMLALNEDACTRLLQVLQHELFLTDVLVLSTCNRTEVYFSADGDESQAVIHALAQVTGATDIDQYRPCFSTLASASEATQHLYEVALGLDAQVVGDMQISNQVKQAYRRSVQADAAGPFLHRLMQSVLAANKRVQQETAFRDGAASTSYATLELVQELTADVAHPKVLIVGLGEIGADICRHFAKSKHFADVVVCNRTRATAAALAAECGLQVLDFAQLAEGVAAADVVISSIAASIPFFTREWVAALPILRPKFFIDLSVPRSIAAEAEHVPGVLVYNIDAIQNKATEALARRVAAVPQVQAIIADSLAALQERHREMQVAPAIHQLKGALEQMRQQELARFQKRATPTEAKLLEDATKSLVQKMLKLPVLQLKAASQRGEADQLAAVLLELFGLEAQPAAA